MYKSLPLLLLTAIILPAAELVAYEAVPQLSETGCRIR